MYVLETTSSGKIHSMKPLRADQVLANMKDAKDRPSMKLQVERWLAEDSNIPFNGKDWANRPFTVRKSE